VENFFRWNFPTSVNVRSLPSRGTRAPPRVHLFGKKKTVPLPGSPPLLLASARLAAACSWAPSAPRLSSACSSVPSAPTSLVALRGRRGRGKGRRHGRCHRGHGRRRGRCHREQGLRRSDLSGGVPQSRGEARVFAAYRDCRRHPANRSPIAIWDCRRRGRRRHPG
jgi:hypothetical protein